MADDICKDDIGGLVRKLDMVEVAFEDERVVRARVEVDANRKRAQRSECAHFAPQSCSKAQHLHTARLRSMERTKGTENSQPRDGQATRPAHGTAIDWRESALSNPGGDRGSQVCFDTPVDGLNTA